MTTSETPEIDVVDPAALAERLERHEPLTILDVRRPERWAEDRDSLPGAVWVPHDQIPRRAGDLPRDRDVIVYCS
jgi:rhodanese-related sulfurtransferase